MPSSFPRRVSLAFRALFDERTPIAAKLAIAGAILYGITPLDLLPDLLPLLGQLDDIAVIALAIFFFLGQTTHIRRS